MEYKREYTSRGFALIKFEDDYRNRCSLQESSVIPHLWLGIDDAYPQILASDAARLGVETDKTTGWVPYPIPEEVQLSTRMHLTPDQALALGKALVQWGSSGGFPEKIEFKEEEI